MCDVLMQQQHHQQQQVTEQLQDNQQQQQQLLSSQQDSEHHMGEQQLQPKEEQGQQSDELPSDEHYDIVQEEVRHAFTISDIIQQSEGPGRLPCAFTTVHQADVAHLRPTATAGKVIMIATSP